MFVRVPGTRFTACLACTCPPAASSEFSGTEQVLSTVSMRVEKSNDRRLVIIARHPPEPRWLRLVTNVSGNTRPLSTDTVIADDSWKSCVHIRASSIENTSLCDFAKLSGVVYSVVSDFTLFFVTVVTVRIKSATHAVLSGTSSSSRLGSGNAGGSCCGANLLGYQI